MARWGKENVTRFIDNVLRINTLIDPSKAWKEKQRRDGVREEDLKPLPELVEAEKKSKLAQQKIVNGTKILVHKSISAFKIYLCSL
mgnify:CR=1 FL=1